MPRKKTRLTFVEAARSLIHGEDFFMDFHADWLERLILEEQERLEGDLFPSEFYEQKTSQEELLSEKTAEFLKALKGVFEKYIVYFNEFKEESERSHVQSLKIYRLSTKKPGFMLFRNGIQLVFYTLTPGEILIHLAKKGEEISISDEHKLESRFIAYGELEWFFKGLVVKKEAMVRYYLTHFIHISRG